VKSTSSERVWEGKDRDQIMSRGVEIIWWTGYNLRESVLTGEALSEVIQAWTWGKMEVSLGEKRWVVIGFGLSGGAIGVSREHRGLSGVNFPSSVSIIGLFAEVRYEWSQSTGNLVLYKENDDEKAKKSVHVQGLCRP